MTSFSSIEASLAFWEVAEYTGTAVVLLGVVGELVAEHDWPSDETKRKRLTRYSTWILVAGLAIEAVALVRSNQLAGRLIAELHRAAESANATAKGFEKAIAGATERIAAAKSSAAGALATAKGFESQIAASKLAASQAEERAKRAEERIAEAVRSAAEASARSAGLELEVAQQRERAAVAEKVLLELQQRVQDRHVTVEQRKKLFNVLATGPKGEVRVTCVGGNPEPCAFAAELVEALRAASGWTVVFGEPERGVMFVGGSPKGVILQVHSGTIPRAIALQNALAAAGIEAPGALLPNSPEDWVNLLIGYKP